MDDPQGELVRISAFTSDPSGGNPAGVWIGAELPPADTMQHIAHDVGYSETAFLAPTGPRQYLTRYYSPQAEVPFCGHATVAAGVVLAGHEGVGDFVLQTAVGPIDVVVAPDPDGALVATLTSVEPSQRPCPPDLLAGSLQALGWTADDLDPTLPPEVAHAGAWHLVLALRDEATLAAMSYDFDALGDVLSAHDVTTVQAVWRRDAVTFTARNPFPAGGVVEDPATGAAAAALAGYLRAHGFVEPPVDLVVHQGHFMGRPSVIGVHVPATGGIAVSGHAATIER